jgi:hypothetical protein
VNAVVCRPDVSNTFVVLYFTATPVKDPSTPNQSASCDGVEVSAVSGRVIRGRGYAVRSVKRVVFRRNFK